MHFSTINYKTEIPESATDEALLWRDNWDDFGFVTSFKLIVFDKDGAKHEVGVVKIGVFGMGGEQRSPHLPTSFYFLNSEFFSLGQDDEYYEKLNSLGAEVRDEILSGLHDIAADADLFERAISEQVTKDSLLRGIHPSTVRNQFRRIARGGARLSGYAFSYQTPGWGSGSQLNLNFEVIPESFPPTNIHVLIGRNGVGKTFLLNKMARALLQPNREENGKFSQEINAISGEFFASLVSVSFSAFDSFSPISGEDDSKIAYSYVGLKRESPGQGKLDEPKTPEMLSIECAKSIMACGEGARKKRWHRAIAILDSDPVFKDSGISEFELSGNIEEVVSNLKNVITGMSSGHKIVLLTMARLIETVAERTLVLIDEPEAHLHPPLLSALVRAISNLLFDRNGVAIIATHSPVVLQEVPRSCAWKLRRSGLEAVAERIEIETFGENVGVLTREVFGYEVTQSGFHKLLIDVVDKEKSYDRVVEAFGGSLGGDARAIARGLISINEREN